jgi:hypothetical protein
MRRLLVLQVIVVILALVGAAGGSEMSQVQKPDARQAQDSVRSSPPDLTPYVRPVIPGDRLETPARPQHESPPTSRPPEVDAPNTPVPPNK